MQFEIQYTNLKMVLNKLGNECISTRLTDMFVVRSACQYAIWRIREFQYAIRDTVAMNKSQ